MFSMLSSDTAVSPKFKYPNIPERSAKELLKMEKEVTGMYFSGNLLDSYSMHIEKISAQKINEIIESPETFEKSSVKLVGMVTSVTVKTTKKNDRMAFISLEDKYGEIECIVFPAQLQRYSAYAQEDNAVLIEGSVSVREDEDPKVIVNKITPLIENNSYQDKPKEKELPKTFSKLYLRVSNFENIAFSQAKDIVKANIGNTNVIFYNSAKKEYVPFELGIYLNNKTYNILIELLGEDNVVPK